MRTSRSTLTLLAAFAALGGLFSSVNAQSVATTPVGAVTVSIAAGSGTTRALTPVSFPLLDEAASDGVMTGVITSVTANSITNGTANWTAGALSTAVAPYLITITSGSASGRYFLISSATANTATTVTIDSEEAGLVNLTTIGLQAGDRYSILRCDTLGSLFGDPIALGVVGGTVATGAGADIVQLQVAGAWRQYYYHTSGTAGWRRVGLSTASNNVVLKPDSLMLYNRIGATPLSITLLGSVPSIGRKLLIRNSGLTAVSNPFPSGSVTLATSGIDQSPGWVKNTSSALSDIVQIQVTGAWRQYYHNGTGWRRVGLNTVSDTVVIPSGAGVLINKIGSTAGSTAVPAPLPYTL